jgi:hypothetical protein
MVVAANTNNPVGFICQSVAPGPRWLSWFLPRRLLLEFHEVEDDSLLFTMQEKKGLLPSVKRAYWSVGDADGNGVGTVERRRQWEPSGWVPTTVARDRLGQAVVVLERWSAGSELPLRVFQPDAPASLTELGSVSRGPEGTLVEFAGTLDGQPFAKMLVLAAVLAAQVERN